MQNKSCTVMVVVRSTSSAYLQPAVWTVVTSPGHCPRKVVNHFHNVLILRKPFDFRWALLDRYKTSSVSGSLSEKTRSRTITH